MIYGIGIDLIEISRIKKAIEKEAFIKKVFSEKEIMYAKGRGIQGASSLAARWAAKEAFSKALGVGISEGNLFDIEIVNDEKGAPSINIKGKWLEFLPIGAKIHITLSHSKEFAIAKCLIEV